MYLYSIGAYQKTLDTLKETTLTPDLQKLQGQAYQALTLQTADKLWQSGQKQKAIEQLKTLPYEKTTTLKLAEWLTQTKDYNNAIVYYNQVEQQHDADSQTYIALWQLYVLSHQMQKIKVDKIYSLFNQDLQDYQVQQLSDIVLKLNQPELTQEFSAYIDRTKTQPSQDIAMVKHDLAKQYHAQHQDQLALAEWQKAIFYSEIEPSIPQNNSQYTNALRKKADDDWLKKSIKSSATEVYKQQDQVITTGVNTSHYSGTSGYSSVDQNTAFVSGQYPLWDGRAKLEYEYSNYNAGRFSDNNPLWGSCKDQSCHLTDQEKI